MSNQWQSLSQLRRQTPSKCSSPLLLLEAIYLVRVPTLMHPPWVYCDFHAISWFYITFFVASLIQNALWMLHVLRKVFWKIHCHQMCREFQFGWQILEDGNCYGHPVTDITIENVVKCSSNVVKTSYWSRKTPKQHTEIQDALGISLVWKTFSMVISVSKNSVPVKCWVPHNLTDQQKNGFCFKSSSSSYVG